MPLNLTTWNAVVTKKWIQSDAFKSLNTSVVAYINQSNAMTLAAVKPYWDAWVNTLSSKDYTKSKRYTPGGTTGDALDTLANLLYPGSHGSTTTSSSTTSTSGPKAVKDLNFSAINQQMISQRNQLNPDVRSTGGNYIKTSGGFKPAIFTQEENNSCTCACATTFLNRLISTPVTEDAFKREYNKVNTTSHNFTLHGSYWPEIHATLLKFGAEVELQTTNSWAGLKRHLDKATDHTPVLFGVFWNNGGSPGGGHAVMCIGNGNIPGWSTPQMGYHVDDPWTEHEQGGLIDEGTTGHYYVKNRTNGSWSDAYAAYTLGCITGRKSSPVPSAKMASHTKVGVKVMQ